MVATSFERLRRAIVDRAFERTVDLLTERRDFLERTARRLLEKETLDEAELAALVGSKVGVDRQSAGGTGKTASLRFRSIISRRSQNGSRDS